MVDAISAPMLPRAHRVVGSRRELDDTVTLSLEQIEGGPTEFSPGQFNMLWWFGVGEAAVSISGRHDGLCQQTIRSVGATTAALCNADVGDVVGVRGPFGQGWNLEIDPDRSVLIVAGGLGLAPLRPAIRALADDRDRGPVTVLIGARSPDQLLYADEIESWREVGLEVLVTVDLADSTWTGPVGLVTELFDRIELDPGSAALVCGPEIMMRYAARGLVERGFDPALVQVSLERNMKCAIGHCGHCQLGAEFICRGGPVLAWSRAGPLLEVADR